MKGTKNTVQTIIIAGLLALGTHVAIAAWTSSPANPPENNVPAPLNTKTNVQTKLGSLWVNATTTNPNWIGLTVGQGVWLTSSVANATRVYIDEQGDTAGYWSGIELKKNNVFQGGLFKKGDNSHTNNDITIWNKTQPVVSVQQDDTTVFAGTVKISGGGPVVGRALTATDSLGSATWQAQSGAGGTASYTLGTVAEYQNKTLIVPSPVLNPGANITWSCPAEYQNVESGGRYYYFYSNDPSRFYMCPWSPDATRIAGASCPDGYVVAGFNLYNVGENISTQGSLYCRQFIPN